MSGGSPYVARDYWDALLSEDPDERAVAYPHLGLALNRAMYDAEREQVARLLEAHGFGARAPGRVLDIGAGTGVWVDFWRRRGAASVVGADLTQGAVAALRRRFPDGEFVQADIGAADHGLQGPFDTISAMSVLLHITDDARWSRALETIAALLAPGGCVVLIEPLVRHRWWGPPFGAEANSKARTLAEWRPALERAGLTLRGVCPATVLLANVVDTRRRWAFRALHAYWEALAMGIGPRERPARAAALLLGALDRPLRRRMPGGPSAKVMLLTRDG